MKIKSFLLVALVMAAFTMHAQPKKGNKGKQNAPKAYKAEMKAFYQNEVYPILKEKHSEFDEALSADDLTKLQNIRSEHKAVKEQIDAFRKSIRAERKEGGDREAFREKYGEKMQTLRKNQYTSMSKLKPIIEGNQELVTSTMTEVIELKKEWGEQMQAIATKHGIEKHKGKRGGKGKNRGKRGKKDEQDDEKYIGETEKNLAKEKGEKGDRKKGKKAKGQRGKGKKGMRSAAQFLLWDGSLKSISEVDATAGQVLEKPEIEQNFPNPATNSTRINFKLPKDAENVSLVITNIDGKVMNQQTFKQLAAGKHQVDLDVASWSKGIYFYTISTEGFKKTKKMSIQ